jgi:hypothetical protein
MSPPTKSPGAQHLHNSNYTYSAKSLNTKESNIAHRNTGIREMEHAAYHRNEPAYHAIAELLARPDLDLHNPGILLLY